MKLVLAPIRGLTDVVYRRAYRQCFGGVDRAVAPFIRLRAGYGLRPVELAEVDPEANRSLPVVPQLLTANPEGLQAALEELCAAGHNEANLNLGCPYPMVTHRGRGSGLLPHPEKIRALLEAGTKVDGMALSVKLRLGLSDPDEIFSLLDVLNAFPLSEVILHPRIAAQMYEGVVDLGRFADVLERCRHPLVYNGDIVDEPTFRRLQTRFPSVTRWMLGRGLLADPFLAQKIRRLEPVDTDELRGRLQVFHDRLFCGYRERLQGGTLIRKMIEQLTALAGDLQPDRKLLKRLKRARSAEAYEAASKTLFSE